MPHKPIKEWQDELEAIVRDFVTWYDSRPDLLQMNKAAMTYRSLKEHLEKKPYHKVTEIRVSKETKAA